MRGFVKGLILGILLSAAGFWYAQMKSLEHPASREAVAAAHKDPIESVPGITNAISMKLDAYELGTGQIKTELKQRGEIIRRKPRDIGESAAGPDSDNRALAEINAQFLADARLSSWHISASCAHGHVTLNGTVTSADDIGKAVAIALTSDGVRDVTSTLQVKSN